MGRVWRTAAPATDAAAPPQLLTAAAAAVIRDRKWFCCVERVRRGREMRADGGGEHLRLLMCEFSVLGAGRHGQTTWRVFALQQFQ